jgi:hypothetical protein
MKRYVIHIEGSPRKRQMTSEMDRFYKGEYEIFKAIVKPIGSEGTSESIKEIIRQNYNEPFIQIFEDDVRFTSYRSRELFEKGFRLLPSDWQLYLGGSYTHNVAQELGYVRKIYDFSSLHNAVINKNCYDHFLNHNPKQVQDIDRYVSQKLTDVYLCNPQIAIQHNGYSYNKDSYKNYDRFLIDKNILHEH